MHENKTEIQMIKVYPQLIQIFTLHNHEYYVKKQKEKEKTETYQ